MESAGQKFCHRLGAGGVLRCNQRDAVGVVDAQHALPLLLGEHRPDDPLLLLSHASENFGRRHVFDTARAYGLVISAHPLNIGH